MEGLDAGKHCLHVAFCAGQVDHYPNVAEYMQQKYSIDSIDSEWSPVYFRIGP